MTSKRKIPTRISNELLQVLRLTQHPLTPAADDKIIPDLQWLVSHGLVRKTKVTADAKRLWPYMADRPYSYHWTEAGEILFKAQRRKAK